MSKEIRQKIVIIKKEMSEKKKRISSLKNEYLSLEEKYSVLQRELALTGVPVISVDLYYDKSDEFERTGGFETEDFLDKRLDVNTSWDEGRRASLSVAIEGSHCAEYSMDENPLDKICSGRVKFTYSVLIDEVYESEVMDSPNNVQGLIYFFRAMHYVEDTHHCYLEGYEIKKENGISIVEFISGS